MFMSASVSRHATFLSFLTPAMLHALRRCANRTIRANVDARRSRPQRRFTHKIAIVGSGPAGFYAAEELIQSYVDCTIDILEKLPTPFGLVRSGVAPDHPEVKSVSHKFEELARNKLVRYFGNVEVGRDVSIGEMKKFYDAIVLAYGADTDRILGIPGEKEHSYSAKSFVEWYNGHPDHANDKYDLNHETAVIIGNGNVAVDVARILTRNVDELKPTDITTYALEKLIKESKVKEVHMVGRRGPVQAAFTTAELRELTKLNGVQTLIYDNSLPLTESDQEELKKRAKKRQFEVVEKLVQTPLDPTKKQVYLHFLKSPHQFNHGEVVLEKTKLSGPPEQQQANGTGEFETIKAGIIFKSIGYKSSPLEGVPFDFPKGIIPNVRGKVVDDKGEHVEGLYVVGWLKRGPSGIIGSNKWDAADTVVSILSDIGNDKLTTKPSGTDVLTLLKDKKLDYVTFDDWKAIEKVEIEKGDALEKIREKVTSIPDMMAIVHASKKP